MLETTKDDYVCTFAHSFSLPGLTWPVDVLPVQLLFGMRTIQKPRWLIYAAQVRVELDNMPTAKSGKRLDAHELSAWKKAMAEMGYEGSLKDWQFLIRELGQQKRA